MRSNADGTGLSCCMNNHCRGGTQRKVAPYNNLVPRGHARDGLRVKLGCSWNQYGHWVVRSQGVYYRHRMSEHKLQGTRRGSQNTLFLRRSSSEEGSVYLKINPPDHHYLAIHVDLDELRQALNQLEKEDD